jgi:hypothetical protein
MLLYRRSTCDGRVWTNRLDLDVVRNEAAAFSRCLELWQRTFGLGAEVDSFRHRYLILNGILVQPRYGQGGEGR